MPANPFRYLIVTVDVAVDVPEAGAVMLRELGLAEREKSGPVTTTKTSASCISGPLVPLTSTK